MLNKMALFQNYPNPFNPDTQISFYLPKKGDVQITVYNILGQEIYTITKNGFNSGLNSITFNGSNFSSGAYFYQIKAGGNIQMKRMLLIK